MSDWLAGVVVDWLVLEGVGWLVLFGVSICDFCCLPCSPNIKTNSTALT